MNKLFYPAFFHKAEEGGFWVSFPDIPECLTEGDDMSRAYEMAVDALGLSLTTMTEDDEQISAPSAPDSLDVPDDCLLVIVEYDMEAYRRRSSLKAVKKTLTIPEWLNEEALSLNLNFSKVLQDALLEKIQQ